MKNKKQQKTDRILIAVPYSQYCEGDTFRSIYHLKVPMNVETSFEFIQGYGVTQARDKIARFAIDKGFDYVLFIDSDVVLPENLLERLYAVKTDIATGWYVKKFQRELTEIFVPTFDKTNIKNITEKEIATANLTEISACGFGCTLVHISVFKKVFADGVYFNWVKTEHQEVSEDLHFCMKAQKVGCKIIVDPTLRCGHVAKAIL